MRIELDLNTIKRNAKRREEENFDFRSYLKGQDPDYIDQVVHELYERVVERVDCTKCGNCCIELETCFKKDEIDRLTDHLNVDKKEFVIQSTKAAQYEGQENFCLKSKPCQFLADKKCTIYELRPEECKSYPYLHKKGFVSRLFGVIGNYGICPIVYNVYEELKDELDFREMGYDFF